MLQQKLSIKRAILYLLWREPTDSNMHDPLISILFQKENFWNQEIGHLQLSGLNIIIVHLNSKWDTALKKQHKIYFTLKVCKCIQIVKS